MKGGLPDDLMDIAHKDTLSLLKKSKLLILVGGFSLPSHRCGHPRPDKLNFETVKKELWRDDRT